MTGEPTMTTVILDRLNSYTGDNIWQDIIQHLDIDEAATEAMDPGAAGSDRFVLTAGQTIRWDPQTDSWYEVHP